MCRELETDVLVVGGGLGGVAAALSVLRLGRRVIVTEETGWIGGQLTTARSSTHPATSAVRVGYETGRECKPRHLRWLGGGRAPTEAQALRPAVSRQTGPVSADHAGSCPRHRR